FWGGPPARWTDSDLRVRQPLVDLIDKGSEFVVRAELPGVAKEDVDLTVTADRSEEHTSELQSRFDLVCRLLLEKKKRSAPRWPAEWKPLNVMAGLWPGHPRDLTIHETSMAPVCRHRCYFAVLPLLLRRLATIIL